MRIIYNYKIFKNSKKFNMKNYIFHLEKTDMKE